MYIIDTILYFHENFLHVSKSNHEIQAVNKTRNIWLTIIFSGEKKLFQWNVFPPKYFFFFYIIKLPQLQVKSDTAHHPLFKREWTRVLLSWERGRIRKELPSDHLGLSQFNNQSFPTYINKWTENFSSTPFPWRNKNPD